ncbi:MAG: phosphoribosylamine--glycine ligase [Ignavibacteria bacterium]|jgi:phosphoribosylamine--glycine ligase|nr:phosphoribosylamine--glycine ligase [Ignavibacteria bacterium]
MKILLVGNGGREHAIAWKICNSPSFDTATDKIYCTYPNPGMASICEKTEIKPDEIKKLLEFALAQNIDLTVVGPEIPLSLGITDEFVKNGLKIFGPSRAAAGLETSKIFAKEFMKTNEIPTAKYKVFDESNYPSAKEFLNIISYPAVIKADGLAAGKGVYIAKNIEDARNFIDEITKVKIFGSSGEKFIIEEFLDGFELSVFAITDGRDYVILPAAQDHKKIGEGDTGKNTGGMGSYSPADSLIDTETFGKIRSKVIDPTIKGMAESGSMYKGCLYCGLMMIKSTKGYEPYVIEYNCRFGDPETQSVLPLIKSDFLELLFASAEDRIGSYVLETENLHAGCIVASSGGYPDNYETGKIIYGLEINDANSIIFHAGTKFAEDGKTLLTSGGRVLNITGLSEESVSDALKNAYKRLGQIKFDKIYYRKDIGYKFTDNTRI